MSINKKGQITIGPKAKAKAQANAKATIPKPRSMAASTKATNSELPRQWRKAKDKTLAEQKGRHIYIVISNKSHKESSPK